MLLSWSVLLIGIVPLLSRVTTHIRDVEENTTILLGIVQSQGLDVKRAVQRLGVVEEHLNTLEQHMESRFEALEQSVNVRFETQDKKLDQILLLLNTSTSKPDQEV